MRKKIKATESKLLLFFFSQMSWVAAVAVAKNAWTIGFWHEDWTLNSMEKSRKPGSPHYLMLARLSSKGWGMVLHWCQQSGGPRPDRATNCPSACLHSLEMVTGQTAHFPWNWTKLWGEVHHMWQRRSRQNSHGNRAPDQSQGPASWAKSGLKSRLSLSRARLATVTLFPHATPPWGWKRQHSDATIDQSEWTASQLPRLLQLRRRFRWTSRPLHTQHLPHFTTAPLF